MKVAHIFWSLGYGGIETMLVNIANAQVQFGENISIIIINDLMSEELLNRVSKEIDFIQLHRPLGSKSYAFVKKLNNALEKISPDVIHLHGGVIYNYLSSKWRESKSCSICSTVHDLPYGTFGIAWRYGRIVQNIFFHQGGNVMNINRVKQVFAISRSVANALSQQYNINSIVIDNGIQTDLFALRTHSTPSKIFEIVQVGRLEHKKKGQDLLIEAIGKITEKGRRCHVTFIGDGDSRCYLENMVIKKCLKEQISFMGAKSQYFLTQHLCDYDLFVQPSRYEGFGLTVAEAMAAKLPVLVSSGQGPAEIVENNTFGWVFENGNADSLANMIIFIMDNYAKSIEKSERAYEYVKSKYDVSVTANKYLEAYRKLMK